MSLDWFDSDFHLITFDWHRLAISGHFHKISLFPLPIMSMMGLSMDDSVYGFQKIRQCLLTWLTAWFFGGKKATTLAAGESRFFVLIKFLAVRTFCLIRKVFQIFRHFPNLERLSKLGKRTFQNRKAKLCPSITFNFVRYTKIRTIQTIQNYKYRCSEAKSKFPRNIIKVVMKYHLSKKRSHHLPRYCQRL